MKTITIAFVALAIAGFSLAAAPKSKPAASSTQGTPAAAKANAGKQDAAKPAPKKEKEIVLFDGASLKNWKKTNFGGEGDVTVENGLLVLDKGSPLTGVTWTGPKLPTTNYEVTLEAKLMKGFDFFCGIGFPVGEANASFVAGGWGGSVCGISTVDGDAAADNDTATTQTFKDNQWYKFRLRVTPERIEVWLDDQQIVDVQLKDRRVAIHAAMEPSLPFGLACYETTAAYRNVKLRKLD